MAAALAVYAGMQLVNGYYASKNIDEVSALNREIADMNAGYAELDAYNAKISGESSKTQYQKVIDQVLSEQQAALTAQNVDVTYGSAAEILEETRFIGELNKMEIEKRAEEAALGYTREARDIRLNSFLQSSAAKSKSSQVKREAVLNAAGAGISGYGRSGGKSYGDTPAKADTVSNPMGNTNYDIAAYDF